MAQDEQAAGDAGEKDEREQSEIEERGQISPRVVYETIRREGAEELERPFTSLAFSGLAAGLSMGFSALAVALLRAHLPESPWRPLVDNLGYTLGFLLVVLGRQQLFTENTLTPILPLLAERTPRNFGRVARLWAIVLAANIAGTVLFAYVITHFSVLHPAILSAFDGVAHDACCADAGAVFVRSVFAGWLIALMVWLLPAAQSSGPAIIIILTYVIALGQFNHVIAGSVEVVYGVMRGIITWQAYWLAWFLPTLAGNIVGGIILVAALNFGQVVAEQPAGGDGKKS